MTWFIHIYDFDRRKPPPPGTPPLRGGFLFTMFPNQEPGGRGPPSKHMVQILQGGSSSSRFLIREQLVIRKPYWGGGVSFDRITLMITPTLIDYSNSNFRLEFLVLDSSLGFMVPQFQGLGLG